MLGKGIFFLILNSLYQNERTVSSTHSSNLLDCEISEYSEVSMRADSRKRWDAETTFARFPKVSNLFLVERTDGMKTFERVQCPFSFKENSLENHVVLYIENKS